MGSDEPMKDCYHNVKFDTYEQACGFYTHILHRGHDVTDVELYVAFPIDTIQLIPKKIILTRIGDTVKVRTK